MGDLVKVGALWLREGKKGKFMSGKVKVGAEEISVLIFKNQKGDNPKRPDYEIFLGGDKPASREPGDDDSL